MRSAQASPAASVLPAAQSPPRPLAQRKRAVSGSLRRIERSVTGSVPTFVTVGDRRSVVPSPTVSMPRSRPEGTSSAVSVAVPLRAIEIGGALEFTVTEADLEPFVGGSKTIRTSQLPPTGTVVLGVQSFGPPVSCVNSIGSLIETLDIGTASLPAFVTVATCGELGPALTSWVKLRVSGARESCAWIPVPDKSTWAAGAFEGTLTCAVLVPNELGSNATPTLQLSPGWKVPEHPLEVTWNWVASAPPITGAPLNVTGPVPVFSKVADCAAVGPAPMLC